MFGLLRIKCPSARYIRFCASKNDNVVNNLRAQIVCFDLPCVLSGTNLGNVDAVILEIVKKVLNRGSHVYLCSPRTENSLAIADELNIPFQRVIKYNNPADIKDSILSLKTVFGYSIPIVFITNNTDNILSFGQTNVNSIKNSSLSISTKLSNDTPDLVFNILKINDNNNASLHAADMKQYVWTVTNYQEILDKL